MTTRIGIVSDVHSAIKPLQAAFDLFEKEKVDKIICAGDIAGYGEDELIQTVRLFEQHECLLVSGNHDEISLPELSDTYEAGLLQFLETLPKYQCFECEGKRIYLVHASPPDKQHGGIKLLDKDGQLLPEQKKYWENELRGFEYDVLIVGHTHQVFSEHIGDMLVINPGSSLFNHSCMILTLPEMKVEEYALGGKEILRSWNWGVFFQNKSSTNKKG